MNYKKPFYTIKIKTQHCGYRLAVNGCLIEEDRAGVPVSMEYPINQWLKNGENTIDLYHLNIITSEKRKSLRADGVLSLELRVKENGEQKSIVLSRTEYDGSKIVGLEDKVDYADIEALTDSISNSSRPMIFEVDNNKIVESKSGAFNVGKYEVKEGITKALQITQTVNLPAPFPLWRFFEADALIYHNDLSDEDWKAERVSMLKVYQPLWDAFNNDDTNAMKSLLAARCKEYDLAFYTEEGQNLYELIVHIKGIINDENRELRKLEYKRVDLCVSFNHKMTWLHAWDRSNISSLAFDFTNADLETRIPVMWSKFDGKWEIVR